MKVIIFQVSSWTHGTFLSDIPICNLLSKYSMVQLNVTHSEARQTRMLPSCFFMVTIHCLFHSFRDIYIITNPCKFAPLTGFHFAQTSKFFLSVPSPEHGTSQRIRSNLIGPTLPSEKKIISNEYKYNNVSS